MSTFLEDLEKVMTEQGITPQDLAGVLGKANLAFRERDLRNEIEKLELEKNQAILNLTASFNSRLAALEEELAQVIAAQKG